MKKIPSLPKPLKLPTPTKPKPISSDLVYVYKCPYCNKTFERKTNNPIFNPHKDRNGYLCGGTPMFVTTKVKLT